MSTALVSAMSGRPVRKDVAMTGEITLRGRVMPIGGLKEKVLGAHRAGIKHIVLPKDNEGDLEDIPEDVRKSLTFHAVSTLDDVFVHYTGRDLRDALQDPAPRQFVMRR